MERSPLKTVVVEHVQLPSRFLNRDIHVDFYLPKAVEKGEALALLLLNDGQDLPKMNFSGMLSELMDEGNLQPMMCVGVHAGPERKMEYGTANEAD